MCSAASDDDCVAQLVKELQAGNWESRGLASEALGRVGKRAAAAVPELCQALGDVDGYVRCKAAAALGQIGAPAEAAVPELRRALCDQSDGVRLNAVIALGQLGMVSVTVAVLELKQAQRDRNESVRDAARKLMHALNEVVPQVALDVDCAACTVDAQYSAHVKARCVSGMGCSSRPISGPHQLACQRRLPTSSCRNHPSHARR